MLQLTSKARICKLCSQGSSFNVISKLIHSGGKGERVIGSLPQYSSGSRLRDPLLGGTSAWYFTGGSAQYCPRLGIPVVMPGVLVSAPNRRFGTSQVRWEGKNKTDTPEDLSQDPQIREWMKELHRDFEKEKGVVEEKDNGISEQESTAKNEGKKTEGQQQDSKKTHHLGQSEDREGNRSKGIHPDIPSSTKVTSESPLQSPVKGNNLSFCSVLNDFFFFCR